MPDLVNCERLADEKAVLERVYELGELPRFKDLLATTHGSVKASFAFVKWAPGRFGAKVRVDATPTLVCQRCMQNFGLRLQGSSDIEFAQGDQPQSETSEREIFRMQNGFVSLRELAEEELLLALPIAPACSTPLTCGNAPRSATGEQTADGEGDMRRPFSALQDLLKKT